MINEEYKKPMIVVVLIVVGLLAYGALTMQDKRGTSDKISDAYHALDDGVDKAARQLEDRTPGQKIGDAVKDAGDKLGDKIKDNTQPSNTP
jgi:hypothetical protein